MKRPRFPFTLAVAGLLASTVCETVHGADPDDPSAELASLKMADGYEVNLFASEKDGVVKPIQIRFDARGRLWVAGSTVYPQIEPGQIPNDKIVVLEDTNGDGRADKSTVFADGLMIPTGLELGDGGVYVGQTTELLHLRDTDGDGKADERRVVLRGFGTGDSHQTINSFTWGPGGEMMMCQGLHALSRVETPWGLERLHSAGVWRLRPRFLRLDPFYNGEMGPQNPFGIAFDTWGQPILVAGNGQGVYYLTPAMIRAEHHLAAQPLWNTGRKFGGADFVENTHFPSDAQGELITGSYLNNAVFRFRIADAGAGFRVEELPPLITSTNNKFRIVDARFGPDGALYLCDWYNPVIGHYQASFRHPDRDKTHGRIWRVTAKGRPLVPSPKLVNATVQELLEQLKSPERWNRQFAKRVLADRPAQEVTSALGRWAASLDRRDARYEHHLFEALGVYESHEAPAPELLEQLLRAKDYRARAYATRVIGHWHDRLANPLELLTAQVNDEHPRVRLEAVVAASYLPAARAVEVATMALDHPLDGFIEYSLIQAIHTLKPHWIDAFRKGDLSFDNRSARLEYFVTTDGSADTLRVVVDRLKSPALRRDTRECFLRILAEVGGAEELAMVLDPKSYPAPAGSDTALQAKLLPALVTAERVRRLRPSGDLAAALEPLLESANIELCASALSLAGVWKLESYRSKAQAIAFDNAASESFRRAAIQALASLSGDPSREALSRLAAQGTAPRIQSAAIAALAGLDLPAAGRLASEALSGSSGDAEVSEIFSAFLQRKAGAEALAQPLRMKPPTKEAAEVGLRLMSASGRRDEQLARVLTAAAGLSSQVKSLTPEAVLALAAEVRASGDAKHGEEIYRRGELNCAACHAIGGIGGKIGPDLGALGTAQTVEFIIESVLDPNKAVKEGFMSIEVTTKDGEEFQGYQVREASDELVLKDVLQQREIRLRRDRIKEKKEHGSVMPAGLADTLTFAEFRDLVRYLSELGRPGR